LFVQSHRTLERAQGGIGVGLTLAKSLIELHGGTLAATSDGEGQGSTFEIQLPLTTRRAAGASEHAAATVVKGSRVVVVEDNADARDMLCDLLTRAGFDCRAVGDGIAALDVIGTFKPHAAIIDVGLPGIDGFELARRIRNDAQLAVRLIAVTGYGQKADRETALDAGFDAHLIKPVKFDQLAKLLMPVD